MTRKWYEVIVGNIGTVFRGTSRKQANKEFVAYRRLSLTTGFRGSGESVTLMHGETILREHFRKETDA